MNTRNTATRFLQAWKEQDYETMQNLSAEFDRTRAESRQVESFEIGSITAGKVKARIDGDEIILEVIPKPGPFQAEKPHGVVFEAQKSSTGMSAKKAISYINTHDDLEGFVPEDENRITVIKALENDS